MKFQLQSNYTLETWQAEARDAWLSSEPPGYAARHGILALFTGAGKTVVALACLAELSQEDPNRKFAIIVPTSALARQWQRELPRVTTLPAHQVGVVGDGSADGFDDHQVLVFVLASARMRRGGEVRLRRECCGHPVTLVVDECHRAGAGASQNIFEARTEFRLGLSATPERSDFDRNGLPISLAEQAHGVALGPVCYRLSLRDGYRLGLLPRYRISHHGISLSKTEREEYEDLSAYVADAIRNFQRFVPQGSYLGVIQGKVAGVTAKGKQAARGVQAALLARKRWLYNRPERFRVAAEILRTAWGQPKPPRGAILFNELIGDNDLVSDKEDIEGEAIQGASTLYDDLVALADAGELPFAADQIELEHSRLSNDQRVRALARLRNASAEVLVSVKSLQEGIDVPDVGLGLSVASTSSARQRIQTMGRILRRPRDAKGRPIPAHQAPIKQLHLLYVRGTTDESIYRQDDWGEQTGVERNVWRVWEFGAHTSVAGQALSPTALSEADAWKDICDLPMPQPWRGPGNGLLLTYKRGSVFAKMDDSLEVLDPDPIVEALEEVEPAWVRAMAPDESSGIRGPFRTTLKLHVILKHGRNPLYDPDTDPDPNGPGEKTWWALGRLDAAPELPLAAVDEEVEEPEPRRDSASESQADRLPAADDTPYSDFFDDFDDINAHEEEDVHAGGVQTGTSVDDGDRFDACQFEDEEADSANPGAFGDLRPRGGYDTWYNWFQYLCYAVVQGYRDEVVLASHELRIRNDHAGGIVGGGTHVAINILTKHPDHAEAYRQARRIDDSGHLTIGHIPLIALAYADGDHARLEALQESFMTGKDRRRALSRACAILLRIQNIPTYDYY